MSGVRAGRPEAAAAIWTWKEGRAGAEASASELRIGGAVRAAIGFGIGLILLYLGAGTFAFVVLGISTAVFTAAIASPLGVYATLDRAFRAAGRAVGRGMTWTLGAPFFYLAFPAFGYLFRRGSRDRMQRFFDPDAPTYWEAHEGLKSGSSSRTRQF